MLFGFPWWVYINLMGADKVEELMNWALDTGFRGSPYPGSSEVIQEAAAISKDLGERGYGYKP